MSLAAVTLLGRLDVIRVGPIDDDWGYQYSVGELLAGRGFRWFPTDSAIHIVQTVVAPLLTLGNSDPRLLRLTALPFLGLAAISIWQVGLRLGGHPFWSAIGGLSVVTAPIVLASSLSFMTDPFYLGLVCATLWAAVAWADGNRTASYLTIALVGLAGLQRQQGCLLCVAAVGAAILARRRRGLRAMDVALVVVGVGVAAFELDLPFLAGFATDLMRSRVSGVAQSVQLAPALGLVSIVPIVGGWTALPLLVALRPPRPRLLRLVLGTIAFVALLAAFEYCRGRYLVSAPQKWQAYGVGPLTMYGAKPELTIVTRVFADVNTILPVLLALAFCQAATGLARGMRSTAWLPLLVSAIQLGPLLETGPFDRYFLPVVVPLLPLVALFAGRLGDSIPARAVSLTVAAFLLADFAVAGQDFMGYHAASEKAAAIAYRSEDPLSIRSDYELQVQLAVIPYYRAHGVLPHTRAGAEGLDDSLAFMVFGPAKPALSLCLEPLEDPRLGWEYRSWAPGKVIIAPPSC